MVQCQSTQQNTLYLMKVGALTVVTILRLMEFHCKVKMVHNNKSYDIYGP